MIRVWLSSIRSNMIYDITVSGSYSIGGAQLSNGSKVKVEFSGGNIFATVNGNRQNMGASATLSRQSGGVKIAQSLASGNTYPGDLRFFYSGGTAYVVCYLYIEEYLYGVLPYEMDNSFPLEALKAQAVTARTYALRAKSSSGSYDVTDTTTHQVFRGVNYTRTRCIQAVDETWGVVLKHGNAYAGTYYSASNGGQTEAAQNAWGGSPVPYLMIKDDPYDLGNLRSVKKTYLIYANPSQGTSTSAYAMVQNALASKFGGIGASYTINQVNDCTVHTPRFTAPSQVFSTLRVDMTYNGGQTAFVDIPIFTTVKPALGLSINNVQNELFTVEREPNGFRIVSRRYGHGVGLSQRGAQQMGESGVSYAQMLGFYYTGVQRVRMNLKTNWPAASPAPVIPPEPEDIRAGTSARVSLENPNDRLNLRNAAGDQGTIIARIPHGETVTIQDVQGLWAYISYSGQTGYVLMQYLIVDQAEPQPPAQGTQQRRAIVTLNSGSLNLRSGDYATASIITTIPNGTTVTLLSEGGAWCQVNYAGRVGYVMEQFLTLMPDSLPGSQPSVPSGGQTASVTLPNPSEILNFRMHPMTTAPILARLAHGTVLDVLDRGAEWSNVRYMGQAGYVMNAFVRFSDSVAATPPPDAEAAQTPSPTPPQETAVKRYAAVSVPSGTLNLRAQPNTAARVYQTIPNGARIEVLQVGDDWCEAIHNGATGYVMRAYLVFDDAAQQAQPEATATPYTPPPRTSSTAWVRTNDGDRVNLRRTGSVSAMVLIRVPHLEPVEVIAWADEWTEVKYSEYRGFIMTEFLSEARPEGAPASPLPLPTQTPGGKPVWVLSGNGRPVNLRREKSASADVLALIPSGEEVTMLETDGEWYKLIHKGLTGYMMAAFISEKPVSTQPPAQAQPAQTATPPPSSAAAATPEPSGNNVYGDAKTTILGAGRARLNSPTATLHLKYAADDLAATTGTLKHQDAIQVLQRYGDRWLYVQSGTDKGYALAEHFELEFRFAAVQLSDVSSQLTVRRTASANADQIGAIGHGQMLTVLGAEGNFAKVRLLDGTIGYVSAEYIRYR